MRVLIYAQFAVRVICFVYVIQAIMIETETLMERRFDLGPWGWIVSGVVTIVVLLGAVVPLPWTWIERKTGRPLLGG
jgi:hypothetical protein